MFIRKIFHETKPNTQMHVGLQILLEYARITVLYGVTSYSLVDTYIFFLRFVFMCGRVTVGRSLQPDW
jgi:hypothetical protein